MAKIQYPRKCPDCEYVANNPAMYSYHIKTHIPIPEDTLCDLGCGDPATIRNTSGNCICRSDFTNCVGYIRRVSVGVTKMWKEGDWDHRKTKQSERTKNRTQSEIQEQVSKQIETKKQKRIILEPSYDRKAYNRTVTYHSNQNYKSNKSVINPNDLPRGKQDYHLDHCVSKFVGFVLGIPVDIISAPKNLRIISHAKNTAKNNKCSLHPIKLLEQVDAPTILINDVTKKLYLVERLLP